MANRCKSLTRAALLTLTGAATGPVGQLFEAARSGVREMVSEELSENLDAIAGRRTTAVIVSTQVIEKTDHILHIALCYNGT